MVTPHFELCRVADAAEFTDAGPKKSLIAIDGSEPSRKLTMCQKGSAHEDDQDDQDAVSWTSLINAIHNLQWRQFLDSSQTQAWLGQKLHVAGSCESPIDRNKMRIISLRLRNQSWDLMPPDIVRPLASTTLGTLIVMAHRMGMTWKDLRPSDGRLRAEGFGQSFSATLIRGLGIVVEYAIEPGLVPRDKVILLWSLRIPSDDADKVRLILLP